MAWEGGRNERGEKDKPTRDGGEGGSGYVETGDLEQACCVFAASHTEKRTRAEILAPPRRLQHDLPNLGQKRASLNCRRQEEGYETTHVFAND